MNCPHCVQSVLLVSNRDGVEIDYCPQCRGVWLDRGELDKIIERASGQTRGGRMPEFSPAFADRDRDDDDDGDRDRPGKRRKRKGFLSEMFDFGD